jgi:phospholipid-translocating ATPase
MSSSSTSPNPAPPPAPPPPSSSTAPQRRESLQRVRFSTEIDIPGGRAAFLTVDTSTTRNSRGPSFEVGERVGSDVSPPPISPRRRNRGYSLRRQLFFRNAQEPLDEGVHPEAAFDTAIAHTTSNDSVELTILGKPSSSSLDLKKSSSGDIELIHDDRPLCRNVLRDNHVSLWAQRHYRQLRGLIVSKYVDVKKAILKANAIPPSKDGRRIPLDVTRKTQLVDERTGHHYLNNYVWFLLLRSAVLHILWSTNIT